MLCRQQEVLVPLKVCLQVIHMQKCHITKYCSKNCIVRVKQRQNGIWQQIISHHEISTGKHVRTHLWAINIKMPKRNVFLYHSPCLPQRQSLAIPRAADGLKKRCKEIAGQANSCPHENLIVRETFSFGKTLLGEKGASVRSCFASCFWAGKTLTWIKLGQPKLLLERHSLAMHCPESTAWGPSCQITSSKTNTPSSQLKMELRPLSPFCSKYHPTPGISSWIPCAASPNSPPCSAESVAVLWELYNYLHRFPLHTPHSTACILKAQIRFAHSRMSWQALCNMLPKLRFALLQLVLDVPTGQISHKCM